MFRTELDDHPAWKGFVPGMWRPHIDVRDFIQRHYTPYEGDGRFLAGPTGRTKALWEKFFAILAYGPGYVDKELAWGWRP